jgi:4-amino-4-deoxy-L-arabinose transferase-like glycosyltransferase
VTFSVAKRALNNTAIVPVVITIICLAPFVGKAFHIDDPLFIWSAQQIKTNPTDFYGFRVNWYGGEMPMVDVAKNPPMACYYIALVASLFGWGEIALHTAFLVPAVVVALGMFYLAKQFCSQPVLAALSVILTPAFLVSSTNIMCDTMMLALWVWAVVLWLNGIKADKPLSLFFAALLIAICALTKYFGMALLPLLFVYSIIQKRRLGVWVLFLLIPVIILAGYQWTTHAFYGRGLLLDAVSYATNVAWMKGTTSFSKGLIGLTFMGGGAVPALFYAPFLWSRRTLFESVILTTLFIFILIGFLIKGSEGVRWSLLIQLGLMATAGATILALLGMDFWKSRNADSMLLGLWILGTFIFASFVNWTINVRSILPLVPPAAILLIRQIDRRSKSGHKTDIWQIAWPLIPAAVIAISVTWADYTWAGTARSAAEAIYKEFSQVRIITIWFQGHWGFQYYMEANGYKPLDFDRSKPHPKDIIVIPSNNTNIERTWLDERAVPLRTVLQFTPCRWLATMESSRGAGFYTDRGGPLPYVIGPVGPEKYSFYVFK